MKSVCLVLLLLSFALTACVVEPGRGYDERGYHSEGHGGYNNDRGPERH